MYRTGLCDGMKGLQLEERMAKLDILSFYRHYFGWLLSRWTKPFVLCQEVKHLI